MLADRVVELGCTNGISHETVHRILKKRINPWKSKGWVIPPEQNSDFVAAIERVLEVYKRPYDPQFPMVCMDKSPKQLIAEIRQALPGRPGSAPRYDYKY